MTSGHDSAAPLKLQRLPFFDNINLYRTLLTMAKGVHHPYPKLLSMVKVRLDGGRIPVGRIARGRGIGMDHIETK